MQDIDSSSTLQMVDLSGADLLNELNKKHKQIHWWKLILCVGVVLSIITNFDIKVIIVALSITLTAAWYDKVMRTTVLTCDFDPEIKLRYNELHRSFEQLRSCCCQWHIDATGLVDDPKYHAGASTILNRNIVKFATGLPPYVKASFNVPVIPAGTQTLYFFPERILVYSGDGIGAVSYRELQLDVVPMMFIEDGNVPRDAKIVDRTWRYTNKSGGPDRRFKGNREIPIVVYERLMFTSSSGLREYFDISATDRSQEFINALRDLVV